MMQMAGMQQLMMEMKPSPRRFLMLVKIGALLLTPLDPFEWRGFYEFWCLRMLDLSSVGTG
jgi:hypothetical protein